MSEREGPRIRAVPRSPDASDEDGALRCPYCHDACEPSDIVSCRSCRAPHHPACWLELAACSVCRARYRVEDGPERLSRDQLVERLFCGRSAEVEAYYREEGQDEARARASAAALAFEELRRQGPRAFQRRFVPTAARVAVLGQALVMALCAHNARVGIAGRSVLVAALALVFALIMLLSVRRQRGPATTPILIRQLGLLCFAGLGLWLILLGEGAGLRVSSEPVAALCLILSLGSAALALPRGHRLPARPPEGDALQSSIDAASGKPMSSGSRDEALSQAEGRRSPPG